MSTQKLSSGYSGEIYYLDFWSRRFTVEEKWISLWAWVFSTLKTFELISRNRATIPSTDFELTEESFLINSIYPGLPRYVPHFERKVFEFPICDRLWQVISEHYWKCTRKSFKLFSLTQLLRVFWRADLTLKYTNKKELIEKTFWFRRPDLFMNCSFSLLISRSITEPGLYFIV